MKTSYRSLSCRLAAPFAALALLASAEALATSVSTPSLYGSKPNGVALPTGCARGEGPQYQRFHPSLGRINVVQGPNGTKVTQVDFYPVALSRRANAICNSFLTGTQACRNACRQLWVGEVFAPKDQFSEEGYARCAVRCAGVPTFGRPKDAVENKANVK